MTFDDYSYKYFNDVVLNFKSIKAINEEEEEEVIDEYLAKKPL